LLWWPLVVIPGSFRIRPFSVAGERIRQKFGRVPNRYARTRPTATVDLVEVRWDPLSSFLRVSQRRWLPVSIGN